MAPQVTGNVLRTLANVLSRFSQSYEQIFTEHSFEVNWPLTGLIMLTYKVLTLFCGCTRTCSHAWWFKKRIIFHII